MRIIAYDPSLRNLGCSVGEIIEGKLHIKFVDTFYIDKLTDKLSPLPEWDIDPNTRRVEMLNLIVVRTLTNYCPQQIIIEEPIFNGKNPNSLQVQMKAITALECAALRHHGKALGNLVKYMPNVIKQGVGITDRKEMSDKTAVTRALNTLIESGTLIYEDEAHLPDNVDDHANDSVAMLYTKYMEFLDVFH